MMTTRIFLIMTALYCATFLVSCKQGDEAQSGISGHVSASEGSSAGAIVKLYEAPDITDDISVWSVTDGEDAVGFEHDISFSFDHRIVSQLLTDTADGNGDFQFESVVAGDYIIVAEKLNQGWSVPQNVSTTGSDVNVGDLRLPRVVVYDHVFEIDANTTWESGTHYVLLDITLLVSEGVTLTIEPGAIVRLAGGSSLEIRGNLICRGEPDNFIRFMPADVLGRNPDEWQQLSFDHRADPPDIAYTSFRNGDVAIESAPDGGTIEFCYFSRFAFGILCENSPPTIRNCVFERVDTGIRNSSTTGFQCERNVFQGSDPFAIILYNMRDCEIYCNWFRDCGGSDTIRTEELGVIKLDLVTDSEIHNNYFETSSNAFQVGSFVDTTTSIHHNVFTRLNTVMNIGVTEDQRGPSNPNFNYNCFSTIDRFVIFYNCNQHNINDMDGTSNYWGTTSLNVIGEDYIHDRDDDGTCPTITVSPIMTSCAQIQTQTGTPAGICQ